MRTFDTLQVARDPVVDDNDEVPQSRLDTSASSSKLPTVPDTHSLPSTSVPTRSRSPYEEASNESDSSFDNEDQDEDQDTDTLPLTHEITLKDHQKVVSALALDPSGARIASGSHDYECKLWDFGGMNASLKPFKSWEPAGSYYVRSLPFAMVVIGEENVGREG